MKIRVGYSRVVFIFRTLVLKIPKFWSVKAFALGIVENLNERYWWCADSTIHPMSTDKRPLAPIRWASSNGLLTIMDKAEVIDEERLSFMPEQDKMRFARDLDVLKCWAKGLALYNDLRLGNVGYLNGRLVAVDYGYCVTTQFWGDRPIILKDDSGNETRTLYGHWWAFKRSVRNFIGKP